MNKTKTKCLSLITLVRKVLSWILSSFKMEKSGSIQIYYPLLSKLELVIRTRGMNGLIQYVKDIRTALLISLANDFSKSEHKSVIGVRTDKFGLPLALGPARLHLLKNKDSPKAILQILLTILFSTRTLKANNKADISTLVSPSKAKDYTYVYKYLKDFWLEFNVRPQHMGLPPRKLWWKEYHISTKSGPNGHALWTSILDLTLLSDNLVKDISYIGGPKLKHYVSNLLSLKEILIAIFYAEGSKSRRLSSFPDKETKNRVVAIGDYWSQTCLIPLHNYLFSMLRKIPQDCTFKQSSFLEIIKDWEFFYSIDLTAFTDRFPLDIQEKLIGTRLSVQYASAWKRIMTGTPFEFKNQMITYSVGNPMGFYSSWSACTLAHHYVIYYCCRELQIPWNNAKYVMLGDDILIGDHDLASMYKSVISDLGVEFSPLKTHESEFFSEFAKRYVFKGEEITPFPISALSESTSRFYLFVTLLRESCDKGYETKLGIPNAIRKYYESVLRFRAKFARILGKRSVDCDALQNVLRGTITANEGIALIARNNGYSDDESSKIIGEFTIPLLIKDIFLEVNGYNKGSDKMPLGIFPMHVTSFIYKYSFRYFTDKDRILNILKMSPHFLISEQMKRRAEELRLEALGSYSKSGFYGWSKALKDLTQPVTDEVFSERKSATIARATAILSDKLKDKLQKQYEQNQSGEELSYTEMLMQMGLGSSFTARLTR